MAATHRPLSPHLQVYRPQITTVLSITHRATGVVLALAAFGLVAWLLAVAMGGYPMALFSEIAASWPGKLALLAALAALVYHLLNGIRHLLWDIGWGYEIPKVYASGYAVVGLTLVITAVVAWCGLAAGGAA